MSLINKLWVKFFCKRIGQDQFGNVYYTKKNQQGREKRYVYYNGMDEASKVPPMWHAWLHCLSDSVPTNQVGEKHDWQQEYTPNLSGTKHAYKPKKIKASDLYKAWSPKK